MYKVFIDGAEGTTGLKIHQYFSKRDDIKLINIDHLKRKDPDERVKCIKKADISFLCLPDTAAKEIVGSIPSDCRILDTSTAHRTNDKWVYGMPELCKDQRSLIKNSARVAVPGCHATGVILLVKPMIEAGIVKPDQHITALSLTGYSGGGKKMIGQYENNDMRSPADYLSAPRQYGLTQSHKHIPEIKMASGLQTTPAFVPVVADFYSGMEVTVPIGAAGDPEQIKKIYSEYYKDQPMVSIKDYGEDGFIEANRLAGSNKLEITVKGNEQNIILVATYDNLGKGASGAAIQNMNIMLGIDEVKGLV